MSLVPSLLQAIVRVDGEALVMHAGDKPYVVSPTGQVDLANRGLTLDAVNGIVGQLLPPELQAALDEFGAVQYELAAMPEFPGEHFTVVAARGGDDVWAEIRRRRIADDDRVPEELFGPSASPPSTQAVAVSASPAPAPPAMLAPPAIAATMAPQSIAAPSTAAAAAAPASKVAASRPEAASTARNVAPPKVPPAHQFANIELVVDDDLLMPDAEQLWGDGPRAAVPQADGQEIELDVDAE